MRELFRNWKVLLWIFLVIAAVLLIAFNGLELGLDFRGGTQFQVELNKKASASELSHIVEIVSRRLDWTGLKDTKVTAWGDQFILVQVAENDPKNVERIELLLKRQGVFEATLDGNVLFEGSDIVQIFKDPQKGYGLFTEGDSIVWKLPFLLKDSAAKRFTDMTFHQCKIIAFDPQAGKTYDCKKTYFFIDRPKNSVLVLSDLQRSLDAELFAQGNRIENIPQDTSIEEVLLNARTPMVLFEGEQLGEEQKSKLQELLAENPTAIIPSTAPEGIALDLNVLGFEVKKVEAKESVPWIWSAIGAREIISLTEEVTNMEPFVESRDSPSLQVYSQLVIRGGGSDEEDAQAKLENLTILLESGSLPIPVKSISKETLSGSLGGEFFNIAILMAIVSLVLVGLVLFVRYRHIKLIFPIMLTCISEAILVLGFASGIGWSLDLAAVAGIVAAVGTGVDDQIVITDELLKGSAEAETSLSSRVKRAFFIVFAAAATAIATMLPIILFGFGLARLVGFAITTIAGVLIGVIITRPAYAEVARYLLAKK